MTAETVVPVAEIPRIGHDEAMAITAEENHRLQQAIDTIAGESWREPTDCTTVGRAGGGSKVPQPGRDDQPGVRREPGPSAPGQLARPMSLPRNLRGPRAGNSRATALPGASCSLPPAPVGGGTPLGPPWKGSTSQRDRVDMRR